MRDCNFDRNNAMQDFERLPKGGYILKILGVKYIEAEGNKSDQLRLQVDIAEGQYADYYKKDYESNSAEDKKWRGVIEIWLPKNDGSDKDAWTKRTMDTCFAAIEDSNPGFRFDGVHEDSLKGKMVGGVVYTEEYMKDGKKKSVNKFHKRLVPIQKIKDGSYKQPEDKLLPQNNAPMSADEGMVPVNTAVDSDELPF